MKELHSQKVVKIQIREGVMTGILLVLTGVVSAYLPSFWFSLIVVCAALFLFVMLKIRTCRFIEDVIFWYDSLLDSIPFPLSVTDKDMNWTFINKPVESMLGIKRGDVVGRHCSNWGAGICKTRDCGITCLKGGRSRTTFEQMGLHFQVDVAYLLDKKGETTGHIEVVQDISNVVEMQRAEQQASGEMSELVGKIDGVCSTFINNIESIVGDINAMSEGSLAQSQSVDELSSAIIGISGKIDENSRQTIEATALVQNVEAEVQDASRQMSEMMRAVQEISEAAQAIENIIKVINNIAQQTNILALNAAVEAARAGEYGKGFAVVAAEVYNLASKSAEAAKNISNLITNSIQKSALGERISTEAAAALDQIVEKIRLSSQSIAQIAEASDLQKNIVMDIQAHTAHVAQIARENHGTAAQSVSESQALSARTRELSKLLSDFDSKQKEKEEKGVAIL